MFTIPKALICPPLPGSLKHTADRKLEPHPKLSKAASQYPPPADLFPKVNTNHKKSLCIGFSLAVSQPSHPVFGLFPHCEVWSQADPTQRVYTCEKSRLSSTVFATRDVRGLEAHLQTACGFGARRSRAWVCKKKNENKVRD